MFINGACNVDRLAQTRCSSLPQTFAGGLRCYTAHSSPFYQFGMPYCDTFTQQFALLHGLQLTFLARLNTAAQLALRCIIDVKTFWRERQKFPKTRSSVELAKRANVRRIGPTGVHANGMLCHDWNVSYLVLCVTPQLCCDLQTVRIFLLNFFAWFRMSRHQALVFLGNL